MAGMSDLWVGDGGRSIGWKRGLSNGYKFSYAKNKKPLNFSLKIKGLEFGGGGGN